MLQEHVTVTPAMAAQLLENNTHNRPVSERTVERYALAMKNGQWLYNPLEPLGFREDGTCCQGQHRLLAIVQSGTSQTFDIRRGVPDHLFPVIDTGKMRAASDVLAISGEVCTHNLAAALKWIERERLARQRAKAGGDYRLTNRDKVENVTLLELLQEHPGLRNSVRRSHMVTPARLILPSVLIWLHYRATRIDAEWAEQYFNDIGYGVDLSKDSPELAVRNWALNALACNRRPPSETVAAIVVKGWNRSYTKKPWKTARWASEQECFPKMEGEEW